MSINLTVVTTPQQNLGAKTQPVKRGYDAFLPSNVLINMAMNYRLTVIKLGVPHIIISFRTVSGFVKI
jgi:hypothetical protein